MSIRRDLGMEIGSSKTVNKFDERKKLTVSTNFLYYLLIFLKIGRYLLLNQKLRHDYTHFNIRDQNESWWLNPPHLLTLPFHKPPKYLFYFPVHHKNIFIYPTNHIVNLINTC